jgi:NDP-4-keto-2,6-dideoxyhexose 3-C-methyltransferase
MDRKRMYTEISCCRICGNKNLHTILDLGHQALTGVFPKSADEDVLTGPLELVKCGEENGGCGLVQMRHSYPLSAMYGDNYGYRSGLNQSMVEHLQHRVAKAKALAHPRPGNIILDIGSNDSTTLRSYGEHGYRLIGMDPTGCKFKSYYPDWVDLIPDFFNAAAFQNRFGSEKAKIVTSIAMFYDLEDPTEFMRQISQVLADDGIWIFEQSYLPLMVERDAYDTVCHEHLSYYGLKQIKWMADEVGLDILDVELNDINGGSFCITVGKKGGPYLANVRRVEELLAKERRDGYSDLPLYDRFRERVEQHRDHLCDFVQCVNRAGKTIYGYGASTKGNVLLQYCGFTPDMIPAIAEVNVEKFGKYTPGTHIPIVSEAEARAQSPDYLLVLPWHFRDGIVKRETSFMNDGGQLVFPLPTLEAIGGRARRIAA